MVIKKSQLYFTRWSSCGALRGGMDASPYQDYVLVLQLEATGAKLDKARAIKQGMMQALLTGRIRLP